jgi:xanthine dehydrogenase small subunit
MPLEVVRATSLGDAAALLAKNSAARLVAGGTLVVRAVNSGDVSIEKLVLCDDLGLDRIAVANDRVELGAAVTMADILAKPQLAFLRPVAESIGGPAVRAMATIGGNLFAPYPYGDFAVALLALDAVVSVAGGDAAETVALEDFLATREARAGRIVKDVSFVLPPEGAFRFAKAVRKHPHGASVLSIAAALAVAGGVVKNARVAYGAMAPTAMRARAVERALEGKPLDADTITLASAVAGEGCAPLSDPQASAWYRLNVLPAHLKRLLAA